MSKVTYDNGFVTIEAGEESHELVLTHIQGQSVEGAIGSLGRHGYQLTIISGTKAHIRMFFHDRSEAQGIVDDIKAIRQKIIDEEKARRELSEKGPSLVEVPEGE